MKWSEFYPTFFRRLILPQGWQHTTNSKQNYEAHSARRFSTNDPYSDVWVGFSGRGKSRALKVERYEDSILNIQQSIPRVHSVRNQLKNSDIAFQSNHPKRVPPESPTGNVPFLPFTIATRTRTDKNGYVPLERENQNSLYHGNQEIGIEHAGSASRIVVWRPTPLWSNEGVVVETDIKEALKWFHSVMAII